MAIDIHREQCIPLRKVASLLPHRPHIATVFRWAQKGTLETVRIAGRTFSSIEAVDRMIAACNSDGGATESAS